MANQFFMTNKTGDTVFVRKHREREWDNYAYLYKVGVNDTFTSQEKKKKKLGELVFINPTLTITAISESLSPSYVDGMDLVTWKKLWMLYLGNAQWLLGHLSAPIEMWYYKAKADALEKDQELTPDLKDIKRMVDDLYSTIYSARDRADDVKNAAGDAYAYADTAYDVLGDLSERINDMLDD